MTIARDIAKHLPSSVVAPLRALKRRLAGIPPVGNVDFGDFRRLTPINRNFGWDRGRPIDRYYIEQFLAERSVDVRGRVLEIGDNEYTLRFGGDRVTVSDVLHVTTGNPKATIVGDLAADPSIPSGCFDAIVLTQTLQLIYDVRAAVATLHRILKPGGVLLVTVPGIGPFAVRQAWESSWSWAFTAYSLHRLLADAFGNECVETTSHGNVLSAVAFLEGLCADELETRELDHLDRDYPVTIAARAVKAKC